MKRIDLLLLLLLSLSCLKDSGKVNDESQRNRVHTKSAIKGEKNQEVVSGGNTYIGDPPTVRVTRYLTLFGVFCIGVYTWQRAKVKARVVNLAKAVGGRLSSAPTNGSDKENRTQKKSVR